MGERTYQNYELDNRPPDLRTLLGVFTQGWNLNWVVCGVGAQRIDPRALVEYMVIQTGWPTPGQSRDEVVETLLAAYNAGEFAVPPWVYEELPELTEAEARAIVDGTWDAQEPRNGADSQDLSQENVTIALEMADDLVRRYQAPFVPRSLYARLFRLLYEGITRGLPVAEVFELGQEAAKSIARGGAIDVGEPEVGGAGSGGT